MMEELNITPLEETIEWAVHMDETIESISGLDQLMLYQKIKEHINLMILSVNEGECASDPEEHIHYLYRALFHLEQVELLFQSAPGMDWTVDNSYIQNEINYLKLRLLDYVTYLNKHLE